MTLRYLFLLLLSVAPQMRARDASLRLGLQDLSREVVGKIKKATGYPTDIFANIFPEHSWRYDSLKHHPVRRKKALKKARNRKIKDFIRKAGGRNTKGGYKNSDENSGWSVKNDREKWESFYGENSGKKYDFMDEDEFTDDHYHREEGDFEKEFKGLRKKQRSFLSKGYEGVYHKDETKKADSFWDNLHKEGKWMKYGSKNKSNESTGKKTASEDKETETKHAKGHKVSEKKETEKGEEGSSEKDKQETTGREYDKKETYKKTSKTQT